MRVSKHYLAILAYFHLEENVWSVNSFLILFFLGLASESLSPPLDLCHWPSFSLSFTPIKKNNLYFPAAGCYFPSNNDKICPQSRLLNCQIWWLESHCHHLLLLTPPLKLHPFSSFFFFLNCFPNLIYWSTGTLRPL